MSGLAQPPGRFRQVARQKLADTHVQGALDTATERLYGLRGVGWSGLDDVEAMREQGRQIRLRTIRELDRHLADFTRAVEGRGGHVRFCRTGEEASRYIADVCVQAGARLAAKSKSMATEEIRLNDALEAAGVRPVETDLGEYILQLAGEHPVHIVAPAIEKTRAQVQELFSRVDGLPVGDSLEELARAARRQLREVFLTADVGITGANFAVAETGSICLVTNEGNGRLTSALPRIHVVVLGMERVVPTLSELAVLLGLLARSATGQKLTTYTTLITGPRREGESDGPEELHVVILDNGRSNLLGSRYEEMLSCIRCSACLNVCPVYRKTGGAAYGPVYSGPMGAVLAPLLVGLEHAPSLPHASSLCGACTAACPVKIPLHEYLLDLRRDLVEERISPLWERLAFTLWSLAWSSTVGYRLSTSLARLGQPLGGLLGPGRAWAKGRTLPSLAATRFRDRR
ncbi:MAG: iron-sulfur cluster-binding protein [Actinobacteria bacterium]|nr:iron-sulfur cluster-binding protein [Actinomycetota bacterium]